MKYKLLFLLLFTSLFCFAQLSDKHLEQLTLSVKQKYWNSQMEGCYVCKVGKTRILVINTIVQSQQNISQQNRVAQMKASRLASEFLNGASNKSVSVYDTGSSTVSTFVNDASSTQSTENNYSSSKISEDTKEKETKEEHETFDDKVIQSALHQASGKGLQKLTSFRGPDEEKVFTYYIVMK